MAASHGEFPIGDDELSDTTERTTYRLVPLDTALLTNPAVVRAAAGIAIGLTVLVWPNRTDRILGRLIGIALVWLAGSAIHDALNRRPRAWVSIAGALVAGAAGAFLVLTPDQSAAFLGRVIGAGIIAVSRSSAGAGCSWR